MLEIAQNLEQTALELNPVVLVVAGLVAVGLGLFVWLGGLGFRRVLVATVGAVAGGVCGFLGVGQNPLFALLSAIVAGALAVVFERVFIIVLTAALAAAIGFALLASPHMENNQGLKDACVEMLIYKWLIVAAAAVVFALAGVLFWRPTWALCCATLGTVLVFAGMIVLLLNKGTAPVSYISGRVMFFSVAFAAMIAFGTVEQLLVCGPGGKKSTLKKQAQQKEEQQPERRSWRTT